MSVIGGGTASSGGAGFLLAPSASIIGSFTLSAFVSTITYVTTVNLIGKWAVYSIDIGGSTTTFHNVEIEVDGIILGTRTQTFGSGVFNEIYKSGIISKCNESFIVRQKKDNSSRNNATMTINLNARPLI